MELLCCQSKIQSRGMMQFEFYKNDSFSCNRRAAHSLVVMLQVSYAIAFQFKSHLDDFLVLFLNFFITFQSFPLGVTFRLWLAFGLWLEFNRG